MIFLGGFVFFFSANKYNELISLEKNYVTGLFIK